KWQEIAKQVQVTAQISKGFRLWNIGPERESQVLARKGFPCLQRQAHEEAQQTFALGQGNFLPLIFQVRLAEKENLQNRRKHKIAGLWQPLTYSARKMAPTKTA
ncbi:MAG: hypothetical protein ACK47M_16650, partial [Caldilinea sp.]